MKLLITAFDAFGNDAINAAQEAVHGLSVPIDIAEMKKADIPTVFKESVGVLLKEIREYQPDAVLCVGQAGGRAAITVERVAINVMDARIPDNSGYQPVDEPIEPDAPAAYFSTFPIKQIVDAIKKEGIPAEVSNTAGTYVCNQLFYGALHYAAVYVPSMRVGFIHVPCIPQQAENYRENSAEEGCASYIPQQAENSGKRMQTMELAQMIQALEIAVKVICA